MLWTTYREGMGMGVGEKVKREETSVSLWLIHADVWQKSTQYCKAIILQLKISIFFLSFLVIIPYTDSFCRKVRGQITDKRRTQLLNSSSSTTLSHSPSLFLFVFFSPSWRYKALVGLPMDCVYVWGRVTILKELYGIGLKLVLLSADEIKRLLLLGRKAMTNLDSVLKSRDIKHHFTDLGLNNQSYGFSSSHVWIWELDNIKGWAP